MGWSWTEWFTGISLALGWEERYSEISILGYAGDVVLSKMLEVLDAIAPEILQQKAEPLGLQVN